MPSQGKGEGFTTEKSQGSAKQSTVSKYEWLSNDELYDDFYASVYHKIFQHDILLQGEIKIIMEEWLKEYKPNEMYIADVCCKTGVSACALAQYSVAEVIAIDKSPAMLRYGKNSIIPSTTLSQLQKGSIIWKQGDVYNPSLLSPAEISHAVMLYFSLYELRDLKSVFQNLATWIRPGGSLVIECVNKYKFDPIPDVANPWIGVSPQRFTKKRITSSSATFDKFDLDTEFDGPTKPTDPIIAEFRETFRFKDGSVRRQKHTLWMPDMKNIINLAQECGLKYRKFVDLRQPLGFNYGYLLFFNRG
jgi:SAM-dependent methyltransferase